MVLETSVLSIFNHLTRLKARENFIILRRSESLKSYITSRFYFLCFSRSGEIPCDISGFTIHELSSRAIANTPANVYRHQCTLLSSTDRLFDRQLTNYSSGELRGVKIYAQQ
jgi:hypothetical protein